ncbi:MAG: addiction module protein [Candidatus Binataceae bacterium]
MATGKAILPMLLKLPVSERARLVAGLVQSLDEPDDPGAADAWLAEIDRRVHEVIGGAARLEKWGRVHRRLETHLRPR